MERPAHDMNLMLQFMHGKDSFLRSQNDAQVAGNDIEPNGNRYGFAAGKPSYCFGDGILCIRTVAAKRRERLMYEGNKPALIVSTTDALPRFHTHLLLHRRSPHQDVKSGMTTDSIFSSGTVPV